MNKIIAFPAQSEYPTYANMYMKYTVKDGSLIKQLTQSLKTTLALIKSLSEDELNFRYQVGKWSIKDILVHIIDDERIFCYRALAFARNDNTNFPGFEQDDYANFADTDKRRLKTYWQSTKLYDSLQQRFLKGFLKLPCNVLEQQTATTQVLEL